MAPIKNSRALPERMTR